MLTQLGSRASIRLFGLCLLLIVAVSCGPRENLTGTYKAETADSPRQAETTLELKSNGDGLWKVGDDEVPFAWYVKSGELRVNTKGGGVIVGTIANDTIQITLPGTKMMSFKKVESVNR